jgi:hypothetical protein
VEEYIRLLCKELISTDDPEEVQQVASKLQRAIHEEVERMRKQVGEIPVSEVG